MLPIIIIPSCDDDDVDDVMVAEDGLSISLETCLKCKVINFKTTLLPEFGLDWTRPSRVYVHVQPTARVKGRIEVGQKLFSRIVIFYSNYKKRFSLSGTSSRHDSTFSLSPSFNHNLYSFLSHSDPLYLSPCCLFFNHTLYSFLYHSYSISLSLFSWYVLVYSKAYYTHKHFTITHVSFLHT